MNRPTAPRSTAPSPTPPRTAAIRTAARRQPAGPPVPRTARLRTVVPDDVRVAPGADGDVEPVLAAMEILVARVEQAEDLARDARRWSSTQRRQVVAAVDEGLDGLRLLRARLTVADDDLPPRAG